MLLTVTMNPSVDISYRLDKLTIDGVNRTDKVSKTAGGKGLNVTRVAKQAGLEVAATGILGGYLGEFIKKNIENEEVHQEFYKIDQESRNCIAILHEGYQTEILESGPTISKQENKGFIEYFERVLQSDKYSLITISGSLPVGMDTSVYRTMIRMANEVNIPVILDASGDSLSDVLDDENLQLKAIKPNIDELNAIENNTITQNIDEILSLLSTERYVGCEWIVVSLGGDGALVKYQNDYYRVKIPEIKVVNPVGSGDATVAGMALGLLKNQTSEEVMKTAMTTGVLNTMNEKTGHIDMDQYDEIFNQIVVEKL